MVCSDLDTLNIRKVIDPKYFRRVIASLERKKDIVIHPTDKGGGMVVLGKT